MMDCKERETAIALFVEGDLLENENSQLTEHLRACGRCQKFAEQLRQSQAVLKSLGQSELPEQIFTQLQVQVLERTEARNRPSWVRLVVDWQLGPAWRPALALSLFVLAGLAFWWSFRTSRQEKPVPVALQERPAASRKELAPSKIDRSETALQKSLPPAFSGRSASPGVRAKGRIVSSDRGSERRQPPQGKGELSLTEVQQAMDRWMQMAALLESEQVRKITEQEKTEKDVLVAKIETSDPQVVIYWLKDAGKGKGNETR